MYQYFQALIAHKRTNCLNDIVWEAEKWAAEVASDHLEPTQLLTGVPISIKDHFSLKVSG